MVEIKNLGFSFENRGKKVLDNITFNIEQKHCVAILGNNGAGKSTLLKCINRIHKADEGCVFVNGENIFKMPRRDMAKNIAYVPQSIKPSHTMVFDAVLLGRKPYIQWDTTSKDKEIVEELLERFGLTDYAARYIDELSGGELQKVVLARAMAQQPRFLLMDEPTSNLDPKNQHETLSIVKEISQEHNIGVAIVLHDLNLAIRYCDSFLFIKDAGVYSYGGIQTVTSDTIKDVYGLSADIIEHKGTKIVIPEEQSATA